MRRKMHMNKERRSHDTKYNISDKYDYITKPHNHAICAKCGKIFDFEYNFEYEKIKKVVEEQTGIEISNKGIALEGLCSSCRNK